MHNAFDRTEKMHNAREKCKRTRKIPDTCTEQEEEGDAQRAH